MTGVSLLAGTKKQKWQEREGEWKGGGENRMTDVSLSAGTKR